MLAFLNTFHESLCYMMSHVTFMHLDVRFCSDTCVNWLIYGGGFSVTYLFICLCASLCVCPSVKHYVCLLQQVTHVYFGTRLPYVCIITCIEQSSEFRNELLCHQYSDILTAYSLRHFYTLFYERCCNKQFINVMSVVSAPKQETKEIQNSNRNGCFLMCMSIYFHIWAAFICLSNS